MTDDKIKTNKGETHMPGFVMPREKYDPIYRKLKEMKKEKALEWAKQHGCYAEVKKCLLEQLELLIVH